MHNASQAGAEFIRVIRSLAWVSLNSCRGFVIAGLSSHCTVRQVYHRGERNLGGAVKPW